MRKIEYCIPVTNLKMNYFIFGQDFKFDFTFNENNKFSLNKFQPKRIATICIVNDRPIKKIKIQVDLPMYIPELKKELEKRRARKCSKCSNRKFQVESKHVCSACKSVICSRCEPTRKLELSRQIIPYHKGWGHYGNFARYYKTSKLYCNNANCFSKLDSKYEIVKV